MSFRATTLRPHHLLAFLLGLTVAPLFGQATDSPIAFANEDAIVTSFVDPINQGGGSATSSSSSSSSQWLKVEFHYAIAPKTGDFLDQIEFRIWIEGRDMLDPTGKPGEGIPIGLTGTVTYVNIFKGKDVYGVFYVHPSTLGRYSTSEGVQDFDRKFDIHLEAYVDGKLMDRIDKKKGETDGWHLQLKAIPGLVYRQNQSPFVNADPDHYPAIKLPEDK